MSQNFSEQRRDILERISTGDKSVKQSIDSHALPICNLINSLDDFVTTSSCSGRISIMSESILAEDMVEDNAPAKKGGRWLFVSHDIIESGISFPEIVGDTHFTSGPYDSAYNMVYFKFEPFILHVACRDLDSGKRLLGVCLQAGYRNSGLVVTERRVMVAVRHTMKMDVPIGFMSADGTLKLIVDSDYCELLVRLANEKFVENFRRMEILKEQMQTALVDKLHGEVGESKQDRLERKRALGLERQRLLKHERENGD
eukprot:Partr_v1_DN25877_c1_g1_i2_m2674 putative tRNA-yW synthesizing protein 3 homolog (S. cerevisiae)